MCFVCDLKESGNLTPAGSLKVSADLYARAMHAADPREEFEAALHLFHWRMVVADAASTN